MPRHDRAHGVWVQAGAGCGSHRRIPCRMRSRRKVYEPVVWTSSTVRKIKRGK